MFDSEKYITISRNINKQRSELSKQEHEMLCEWKTNLENYFNTNVNHYFLINNDICAFVDGVDAGIMRTKGTISSNLDGSICWFRLKGVIFQPNNEKFHNCFTGTINVNQFTNIQSCSYTLFKSLLDEKCSKLFNNTPENKDKIYSSYSSYFHDEVLTKYAHLFPEYVHEFIHEMEERLNNDLAKNEYLWE